MQIIIGFAVGVICGVVFYPILSKLISALNRQRP